MNSSKVNILRADTLSLELDELASDGISIDNAIPVRDSVGLETTAYTFKLKNNGTTSSDYTIYLDDLDLDTNQTRMQDKFIKYSLTKDGSTSTTALLPTIGVNPNRILESGTIGADTTITYTLRLWIDSDATNEVMGTTFKGQLRIEATQSQKTGYNYTNKNIKAAYVYDETDSTTKCISGEESTCKQISLTNTDTNIPIGTIIKYAVNDTEQKYFYVLHDDGTALTLQQRENTIRNIAWYSSADDNTKGPLTILPQLETATSTWTNVNEQTYTMGTTVFKDNAFTGCTNNGLEVSCGTNTYTLTTRTSKARMITLQEAVATGCKIYQSDGSTNGTCPNFMYNYLYQSNSYGGSINDDIQNDTVIRTYGYWTMSSYSLNNKIVWDIHRFGNLFTDTSTGTSLPNLGARAVVVVSK